MCFFGGSKKSEQPAPPAPAPPPAEANAGVAQAEPESSLYDETASKRKGRSALRIDLTKPTVSGGSGLNIPV